MIISRRASLYDFGNENILEFDIRYQASRSGTLGTGSVFINNMNSRRAGPGNSTI